MMARCGVWIARILVGGALVGCALVGCATAPRVAAIPFIPAGDLPLVEPRGLAYRVQPGDTWYGIARRNGLDLERLLARNGRRLEPGTAPLLRAGETILIPQDPPEIREIRRASGAGSERANDPSSRSRRTGGAGARTVGDA
ncbi:MAG: LysM peptidoglycan-binding domain-containing protein [Planctomycetes bacterium]|nr:LysM peptidoglycan-binding domain-containing protein [Planctomycetota bacterium]